MVFKSRKVMVIKAETVRCRLCQLWTLVKYFVMAESEYEEELFFKLIF